MESIVLHFCSQWMAQEKVPLKTTRRRRSCGGAVTAEVRDKKLKYSGHAKHVYYHCGRHVDYDCDELYITEEELLRQLIGYINKIKFDEKLLTKKLKDEIERFHTLKSQVLRQEFLKGNPDQFDYPDENPVTHDMAKAYLLHVLKAGTFDERQQILSTIKTKFILTNRELRIRKEI